MIPIVKLMLVSAAVLGVLVTTINGNGKKKGNSNGASGSNRGEHVFNNNLLKFHHKVLEKLLKDFNFYDQHMKDLEKDLKIPLSENVKKVISETTVHFSPEDNYVDRNANVYGRSAEELRNALVDYLKAYTSANENEANRFRTRVQDLATQMVNNEVYVDPMALERWLQEKKPKQKEDPKQLYNQVRGELRNMFQNILQDFKTVSERIRVLLGTKM